MKNLKLMDCWIIQILFTFQDTDETSTEKLWKLKLTKIHISLKILLHCRNLRKTQEEEEGDPTFVI